MSLNRQRLHLIDQVSMYSLELDNMSSQYIKDTRELQSEIDRLKEQLSNITYKYEISQKQSREQVLAIGRLVNSCKCNDSVYSIDSPRTAHAPSSLPPQPIKTFVPEFKDSHLQTNKLYKNDNIAMFSDEIGKGMGPLMLNTQLGHSFSNYCMPHSSFNDIMEKVLNSKSDHNVNTSLVIFVAKNLAKTIASIEQIDITHSDFANPLADISLDINKNLNDIPNNLHNNEIDISNNLNLLIRQ
ncbi:unnamed protein product [Arctia plantaginis]|uniref:Uncharacterized protein n=1 Tax=Arctia plantaginis TaxID=874455 RepID=A0A8S0Z6M4_ARCPL|nr:unnamed protein product [Arctia plantaginis]